MKYDKETLDRMIATSKAHQDLIIARISRIPKDLTFEQECEWLRMEGLESLISCLKKHPRFKRIAEDGKYNGGI